MTAIWQGAFWTACVLVLVLSLAPADPKLPTMGWDKANHAVAFLVLALFILQGYPNRPAVAFVGLIVFGGVIEVLQSFTPDRLAEWEDWFADGVGLAIGFGTSIFTRRLFAATRQQ